MMPSVGTPALNLYVIKDSTDWISAAATWKQSISVVPRVRISIFVHETRTNLLTNLDRQK